MAVSTNAAARPSAMRRSAACLALLACLGACQTAGSTRPIFAPNQAGAPGATAAAAMARATDDPAAAECAALSETDPARAEPACRRAIAAAEASLGQRSAAPLALRAHLAAALVGLDRAPEAVPFAQGALAGLARALGPWHRDTEGARQVLLAALADTGNHGEAMTLIEATLQLPPPGGAAAGGVAEAEVALARAHVLREKGNILRGLGRWREAVGAYEAAQGLTRQVLGDSHPVMAELIGWISASRHAGATTAALVAQGRALPITGEFRGRNGLGCLVAGGGASAPVTRTGPVQAGVRPCLRLGIVAIGDPVERHEAALGAPFQRLPQADGSEARLYALPGGRPPAAYLVLQVKAGQVAAVQLTGRLRPNPVGLSSVFLGDYTPALLALLGEPFIRQKLPDRQRELWLYGPDDVSFEIRAGRVVSMRISGAPGAQPPAPASGDG